MITFGSCKRPRIHALTIHIRFGQKPQARKSLGQKATYNRDQESDRTNTLESQRLFFAIKRLDKYNDILDICEATYIGKDVTEYEHPRKHKVRTISLFVYITLFVSVR